MRANYRVRWADPNGFSSQDFTCPSCGREVSNGWGLAGRGEYLDAAGNTASHDGATSYFIVVCPRCGMPVFLVNGVQIPGVPFGEQIDHLPEDVRRLYSEARSCMEAGAHNAAVLVGRKLLMHVGVERGAP